jgi:putative membrane protein
VTLTDSIPAEQAAPWRRLSVRMLAVHPVRELLRAWPALIGALLAGRASGNAMWILGGVTVVVVLGLTRWFTTTYRITQEQVQVRRGLLRRETLTVPRDRVRTVDVTASPLHRVLGLARVSVGTGRSDRKDDGLHLDALTSAEADRLRVELLRRTAPQPADAAGPAQPAPETVLAQFQPAWLRYGPFTLSGLVTVLVVAGFVSRLVNEAHVDLSRFGPLKWAGEQLVRAPLAVAVVAVVAACVVVVAVASTVGYLVAFWGFRLTRQPGGTLHLTRGLLTSRAITIEERRLRGVELSESLLLRAVGGARCLAIATGLRVGRGAERGGTLLLPPASHQEAVRVAGAVVGDPEPVSAPLVAHGPRAHRRRYTRALLGTALVPAALTLLWWLGGWPGWPAAVSPLLLPLATLVAEDRYRSLGHLLAGPLLVVRQGSLVRRRCLVSRDGIIGVNLHQSFFQRRAGVVTVVATTAAGKQRYAALDVPAPDAVRLADQAVPGLLTPFLAPVRHPVL